MKRIIAVVLAVTIGISPAFATMPTSWWQGAGWYMNNGGNNLTFFATKPPGHGQWVFAYSTPPVPPTPPVTPPTPPVTPPTPPVTPPPVVPEVPPTVTPPTTTPPAAPPAQQPAPAPQQPAQQPAEGSGKGTSNTLGWVVFAGVAVFFWAVICSNERKNGDERWYCPLKRGTGNWGGTTAPMPGEYTN